MIHNAFILGSLSAGLFLLNSCKGEKKDSLDELYAQHKERRSAQQKSPDKESYSTTASSSDTSNSSRVISVASIAFDANNYLDTNSELSVEGPSHVMVSGGGRSSSVTISTSKGSSIAGRYTYTYSWDHTPILEKTRRLTSSGSFNVKGSSERIDVIVYENDIQVLE